MENIPSNKTETLTKRDDRHLGSCYIKSTIYKRLLNWNKKKVVTGKTPFVVIRSIL